MYLLNFTSFLKQLLPPPWRDNYVFNILYTLLSPIEYVLCAFADERTKRREQLQINIQVFPLQAVLSNIMQAPVRIEHRISKPFTFFVRIHTTNGAATQEIEAKKVQMQQLLMRYKLAGTSFEIEEVQATI